MLRHITLTLLKTKYKKKKNLESNQRKTTHYIEKQKSETLLI